MTEAGAELELVRREQSKMAAALAEKTTYFDHVEQEIAQAHAKFAMREQQLAGERDKAIAAFAQLEAQLARNCTEVAKTAAVLAETRAEVRECFACF